MLVLMLSSIVLIKGEATHVRLSPFEKYTRQSQSCVFFFQLKSEEF